LILFSIHSIIIRGKRLSILLKRPLILMIYWLTIYSSIVGGIEIFDSLLTFGQPHCWYIPQYWPVVPCYSMTCQPSPNPCCYSVLILLYLFGERNLMRPPFVVPFYLLIFCWPIPVIWLNGIPYIYRFDHIQYIQYYWPVFVLESVALINICWWLYSYCDYSMEKKFVVPMMTTFTVILVILFVLRYLIFEGPIVVIPVDDYLWPRLHSFIYHLTIIRKSVTLCSRWCLLSWYIVAFCLVPTRYQYYSTIHSLRWWRYSVGIPCWLTTFDYLFIWLYYIIWHYWYWPLSVCIQFDIPNVIHCYSVHIVDPLLLFYSDLFIPDVIRYSMMTDDYFEISIVVLSIQSVTIHSWWYSDTCCYSSDHSIFIPFWALTDRYGIQYSVVDWPEAILIYFGSNHSFIRYSMLRILTSDVDDAVLFIHSFIRWKIVDLHSVLLVFPFLIWPRCPHSFIRGGIPIRSFWRWLLFYSYWHSFPHSHYIRSRGCCIRHLISVVIQCREGIHCFIHSHSILHLLHCCSTHSHLVIYLTTSYIWHSSFGIYSIHSLTVESISFGIVSPYSVC